MTRPQILLINQHRFYLLENLEQFGLCFGTEHANACFAEIGYALEERTGGQVAAYMQDATTLVQ